MFLCRHKFIDTENFKAGKFLDKDHCILMIMVSLSFAVDVIVASAR